MYEHEWFEEMAGRPAVRVVLEGDDLVVYLDGRERARTPRRRVTPRMLARFVSAPIAGSIMDAIVRMNGRGLVAVGRRRGGVGRRRFGYGFGGNYVQSDTGTEFGFGNNYQQSLTGPQYGYGGNYEESLAGVDYGFGGNYEESLAGAGYGFGGNYVAGVGRRRYVPRGGGVLPWYGTRNRPRGYGFGGNYVRDVDPVGFGGNYFESPTPGGFGGNYVDPITNVSGAGRRRRVARRGDRGGRGYGFGGNYEAPLARGFGFGGNYEQSLTGAEYGFGGNYEAPLARGFGFGGNYEESLAGVDYGFGGNYEESLAGVDYGFGGNYEAPLNVSGPGNVGMNYYYRGGVNPWEYGSAPARHRRRGGRGRADRWGKFYERGAPSVSGFGDMSGRYRMGLNPYDFYPAPTVGGFGDMSGRYRMGLNPYDFYPASTVGGYGDMSGRYRMGLNPYDFYPTVGGFGDMSGRYRMGLNPYDFYPTVGAPHIAWGPRYGGNYGESTFIPGYGGNYPGSWGADAGFASGGYGINYAGGYQPGIGAPGYPGYTTGMRGSVIALDNGEILSDGDAVFHPHYGEGILRTDRGNVVVRFASGEVFSVTPDMPLTAAAATTVGYRNRYRQGHGGYGANYTEAESLRRELGDYRQHGRTRPYGAFGYNYMGGGYPGPEAALSGYPTAGSRSAGFAQGDNVQHPEFGEGVVDMEGDLMVVQFRSGEVYAIADVAAGLTREAGRGSVGGRRRRRRPY